MKRITTSSVVRIIVIFFLLVNIPLLVTYDVLGFDTFLQEMFRNGYFANYLSGTPIDSVATFWFTFIFTIHLVYLFFFLVLYLHVQYRDIGSKLLLLTMILFLTKGVVFFLYNNNEFIPWSDKAMYAIVFLFILIKGGHWKYEYLVSDKRDIRYLQFTINRPSKFKHLIGSLLRMTPAGSYRALIYAEYTDEQWNFPSHSFIERSNYVQHSSDVIKTALGADGRPIPACAAQKYIESHHTKFHWRKNNCDNYWSGLVLPSKLFRVSLKRK